MTGPILSYSKPFNVRFKTDGAEPESGVAANNRGFQLRYTQIPCSLDKTNAINFS